MERLTKIFEDGPTKVLTICQARCGDAIVWKEWSISKDAAIKESLMRLAAYEDTGLEPEEIKQMCALARLNSNIFDNDFGNHIAELIVAEQDGRLLVLPCKVGGTVYFVADGAVKETRLLAIKANVSDPAYSGNPSIIYEGYFQIGMRVMCWSIGNRLYLTRAEAEAVLAGEGGHDG